MMLAGSPSGLASWGEAFAVHITLSLDRARRRC